MSEQPGQGDGAAGRDTAPAPSTGGPTGPEGGTDRSGWRALWLGAGALVLTPFGLFPVALVLAIAALVVGIKARRRAGRTRTAAPGALPGIVLGAVGLAMATLWLASTVWLWPEIHGYQQCLGSANTSTDEQVCRDRYLSGIDEKLDLPAGTMSRYRNLF